MTLDQLLAREGIRDLVARYNSYGDTGRFDALFDLFAEDAVMETGDAGSELTVHDGRENVKKMFLGVRERVSARSAKAGPTYVRHFTATHQIDLVDADRATGRCYFAVIIDAGLDHWGRYVDEYVRIGGEWKLKHRKVTVDGRVAHSWFAP